MGSSDILTTATLPAHDRWVICSLVICCFSDEIAASQFIRCMEELGEVSLMPRYWIVEWGAQEKPRDAEIVFLRFLFSAMGIMCDFEIFTLDSEIRPKSSNTD